MKRRDALLWKVSRRGRREKMSGSTDEVREDQLGGTWSLKEGPPQLLRKPRSQTATHFGRTSSDSESLKMRQEVHFGREDEQQSWRR